MGVECIACFILGNHKKVPVFVGVDAVLRILVIVRFRAGGGRYINPKFGGRASSSARTHVEFSLLYVDHY